MKTSALLTATAALGLAIGMSSAQAQTVNVVTAGSQNMVDYVTDYLGPLFEEQNPGVTVRAAGTGPGDAGSQKIFEKLDAQMKSGTEEWDVDVAVVHQKMAGQMREADLLAAYRGDIETGDLVSRDTAKMALGVDVDGYVMPMFHSQTAIAYNPDLISDPPSSYAELKEWVKENPGQFGYNGIKQGMSGVSFVVGWIYANSDQEGVLANGPYDAASRTAGATFSPNSRTSTSMSPSRRAMPVRSTCSTAAKSAWARSGSTCSTRGRATGA